MATKNIDDTQLINGVIHEIKNPIALIKANIDLIKFQNNDFEKNFNVIYKQLDYIEELTCNYLTTFKNREVQNVYLDEILEEVVNEYKHSYKDIAFKYLCENTINILGDKKLFTIVVKNMIKNCVESIMLSQKENPDYIGKIFVTLNVKDDDLVLTIIDNGIGYSSDRQCNGSGVGLKIIKKILDIYNSTYHIYSSSNVTGAVQKVVISKYNKKNYKNIKVGIKKNI